MKKYFTCIISVLLALVLTAQVPLSAFAASKKSQYVSEVILSYGNTDDEAKKWLTDNGYEVVDSNLNEGADDSIYMSVRRSVYLGYKTTSEADEAITDMKLMNMSGGYSVQDYQILLEEKKTDIRSFIENFIVVLDEYRENYSNNVQRAVAAHDELNMLCDDDTGLPMGDLLLNKIKEEYSEKEFAALTADEQKKCADMTTILMQGNAELVLTIEQLLGSAADNFSNLWPERYQGSDNYDDMLDKLVDDGMTITNAEKKLSGMYDDTASVLAALIAEYQDWLKPYLDSGYTVTSDEAELEKYFAALSDEDKLSWLNMGFQCLRLSETKLSDGSDLLDLFTGDYDLEGEDKTMLYPLASVLSDGQKASLQFMFGYQFVNMGFSSGSELTEAVENCDVEENKKSVSVYDGVDRTMYDEDVALTGEAYKLQTSSDNDYSDNWFTGGISDTTKILGIISAVSVVAATGSLAGWKIAASRAEYASEQVFKYSGGLEEGEDLFSSFTVNEGRFDMWSQRRLTDLSWSKFFAIAGIGLTIASVLLTAATLWQSYKDLKDYYHAAYTPIPGWMVDEASDENGEKVFTYYKAVLCNRVEGNFVTDNNELLKSFGDINGDVGKQWVALYTTKDKAAGSPITPDFTVQYGNTNIPGTSVPLSIFCESAAQNLTNEKAGYTYNDSKGGIYLFYGEDSSALAGSAITSGTYVAIGVGCVVIIAAAVFLIVRAKKKKSTSAAGDTPEA